MAVVGLGTVGYYQGLFASEAAREAFLRDLASAPALLGFNGPLLSDSIDAVATWRMRDLCLVLVAVMGLLTVVRLARGDEESGSGELVGAAVVGRHAPLASAVVVTIAATSLAAVVLGAGMASMGLDVVGSAAYAASLACTGAVATGIGAVAAQLVPRVRDALAIGGIVVGASYLLRFAADALGLEGMLWATPTGWAHLVRPFAGERWLVLVVPVVAASTLLALSHVLLARRDHGDGLLPARRGPAHGTIGSTLGLALRLQRSTILAWTIAFAVAGAFFGGLVAAVGGEDAGLGDSVVLRGFLERYTAGDGSAASADVFLWVAAATLGYTVTLLPALAMARLWGEERSGRAELLLAEPTTRAAWVGAHAVVAACGTVVALAAGGLGAGLVVAAGTGDAAMLGHALAACVIQAPAALVLGGVTPLALGVLPRAVVAVAWAGFLLVQLFELVGPIAGVDLEVVAWVVPYFHLPRILTGDAFTAWPILGLLALTAALGAIGIGAVRRRDLAA